MEKKWLIRRDERFKNPQCNKVKYESTSQAIKAIEYINSKNFDKINNGEIKKLIRHYLCPECNRYHITSMPKKYS
jgi:hypothetical protein